MRMPKVGNKVICLEDESLGEVVSLTAGGSPDITFNDGSRGTYLLHEFAELFGYVNSPQQQAEPVAWDVFELRLYGAPQEKQHRVLWVERYIQPNGLTPDLDGLLEAAKTEGGIDGGAKTLHVRPLYTTSQQQQAKPMAWDKPSASFDEWWDGDRRRDNANPFTTDSFAYWAWEGWQAALAQRPWQGLEAEDLAQIESDEFWQVKNHMAIAMAVEAKLKELNK